jgi:AraC family transcriptional regulator
MTRYRPSENNRDYLRKEYASRINRVIDYIEAHLDKDLSLETLAKVACFSRYHFHRLFGAITGESLGQFILRIRVEKAASKLIHNPKESITQIAFECGFSGSAAFAKAFRKAFGMSAREWRAEGRPVDRKICKDKSNTGKTFRNNRKDLTVSSLYIEAENITLTQTWRIRMKTKPQIEATVEVKEIPEMLVAYVRHIGPYKGNDNLFKGLFGKLMTWAAPRGLLRFPETKMLTVYHDDPQIADEDKLRIDVCISVPEGARGEGDIGTMTIPGGKDAVARFEISPGQYLDAWNAVYGGWFPESGYQPDDRPCYEVYLNDPRQHPEGKHIVEIHAPVRPL